ncbi:hypothetical protein D9X30_5079 [Cupriavidus sp. U2]|nr:hypothetical protein D9X30_5079 [Cupriavidus sp. U2]
MRPRKAHPLPRPSPARGRGEQTVGGCNACRLSPLSHVWERGRGSGHGSANRAPRVSRRPRPPPSGTRLATIIGIVTCP